MNPRILILGAGISGLSAAWKLQQLGFQTILLEKTSETGGLAGTVRQQGYGLDYGPHSFFTEDPEIRDTVLSLFDPPLESASRSVKFFFHGKTLDYPLTAASVLFQMGIRSGLRAVLSYLRQRLRKTPQGEASDVESWALRHFGPYLYRFFFKPYTEQFWKYPCTELSPRTIPTHTRLSFAKTLKHLLARKTGASQLDREKLPTFYPRTGYGEIAAQITVRVQEAGGEILFNTCARRCIKEREGWRVEADQKGEVREIQADHIISTIPIRSFVSALEPAPPFEVQSAAASLKYRPILMLGIITSRKNILPASYLYTLHRPYNRITEMNQFSERTSPPGKNILAVEIPCRPDSDDYYQTAEELFEKCLPALEQDGVLRRNEAEGLILAKAPEAYPVYLKNYETALRTVQTYLAEDPSLSLLGRTGEFRYMDADQCMRRAFDLAGRLAQIYREREVHEAV
jgi:protoporphyrinogen oxidase